MTTSPNHSTLSEPAAGSQIPLGTLVYFRERNKQTLHEIVTDEFERSGLTVKELALRTGRDTSRVSKFLSEVGNWTLDTISDYLFAMSGAKLEYRISYPLKDVANNYPGPAWLREPPPIQARPQASSVGTFNPMQLDAGKMTITVKAGST